jgi:outer membrane protein TolC
MLEAKPYIALLCSMLLVAPAGFAADKPTDPKPGEPRQDSASLPPTKAPGNNWIDRLIRPYRPAQVAQPTTGNSPRLESLLRGGNLYLSLQDAIALTLENNMDIAIQRYGPELADAAVLQAEAGAFARGVSTGVTAGPSGVTVSSSGTTPGTNLNSVTTASSGSASAVAGSVVQSSGPSIPSLDPVLVGSATWAHSTTPQSNTVTTGTTALINTQAVNSVAVQKGFLTGTTVSFGLSNNTTQTNSVRNIFNPATSSALSLTITQNLLQGFGPAVNSRQIHIAKNNREVSDLTFKLQVETTVASVMELYWQLVALNDQVRVAQEAITSATRLYEDNKRQVEVGTLAPIEVTRAEAQIAAGQQQLVIAQTQVLQQETILKTALSRNGVASPLVADAHIIATDRINIPDVEPISPIQDMTAMALSARPELAQSRIQITNQTLTIRGSRNALLPTLQATAGLANNGLAGDLVPNQNGSAFFIGGYGSVLNQIFSRNFPNYSAGFNLNIPIRNRAAQAQVINDELTLRQQQLGLQRLENQVRVDVQNALIGLTQARAQYQAATKARLLQAQTLDAEQKKLALGASTIYNVIQDQQALTLAESNEVTAKAAYARAKVELDRATGQILTNNNISMDEAFRGKVSRPPAALPPASAGAQ